MPRPLPLLLDSFCWPSPLLFLVALRMQQNFDTACVFVLVVQLTTKYPCGPVCTKAVPHSTPERLSLAWHAKLQQSDATDAPVCFVAWAQPPDSSGFARRPSAFEVHASTSTSFIKRWGKNVPLIPQKMLLDQSPTLAGTGPLCNARATCQ